MKYAISNIAWQPAQRRTAYTMMHEAGFTGLEIAPGLFLNEADDPFDPSDRQVRTALDEASGFGLHIVSMQSLLFGRPEAKLFGDRSERQAFADGMAASIALAGRLGIGNLVFGSPAQRVVPEGMSPDDAQSEATEVFRALAGKAQAAGAVIAMEPNPARYGTNFLTTLSETVAFIRNVDHPALRLNLDTGALLMNGEFDDFRFAAHAELVSHVHVSAPMLAPAPADVAMSQAIQDRIGSDWKGWLSIEMRRVEDDDGLETLSRCMNRLVAEEMTAR